MRTFQSAIEWSLGQFSSTMWNNAYNKAIECDGIIKVSIPDLTDEFICQYGYGDRRRYIMDNIRRRIRRYHMYDAPNQQLIFTR